MMCSSSADLAVQARREEKQRKRQEKQAERLVKKKEIDRLWFEKQNSDEPGG